VQRELSNFVNLIPPLEQATGRLVPQVMKSQIHNTEDVTRLRECVAHAFGLIGKYAFVAVRLPLHDRPSFLRVLESTVVTFLLPRVLRISHKPGSSGVVIVRPFEPTNLSLPSGRSDRELHNVTHRDHRAPIARPEKLREFGQLI
jgi:hypothetical protein